MSDLPKAEIIAEDATGALAWVEDEIVFLTKEREPESVDDALLASCGFKPTDFTSPEHKAQVLAKLAPRRATIERLLALPMELALHAQGLGPKPAGVLLDYDRGRKRK